MSRLISAKCSYSKQVNYSLINKVQSRTGRGLQLISMCRDSVCKWALPAARGLHVSGGTPCKVRLLAYASLSPTNNPETRSEGSRHASDAL